MCKPNFLIMRITRFMYKHTRTNNVRQILIYLMHVQVSTIFYLRTALSLKMLKVESLVSLVSLREGKQERNKLSRDLF